MRRHGLIFICLLLAACSPSAAQIQTAIAETQTSLPAPRSPGGPFASLNLQGLVILPNDLPAGCKTGQITHTRTAAHIYDQYDVPPPDNYIGVGLSCGTFFDGLVQVFVYQDLAGSANAYQNISTFLAGLFKGGKENSVNLGDESLGVESALGENDLVVHHCHAVITVDQIGEMASMTAYAKRLDSRLGPIVCK
jgi:hypothetical protein